MSSSFVGASVAPSFSRMENESVKISLYLRIHLNSHYSGQTDIGKQWVYMETLNPQMKESDRSFIKKERDIIINTPVFEKEGDFLKVLKKLVKQGENYILAELISNSISELQVHIYLYGVNTGDIVSHLFSSEKGNCGLKFIQDTLYGSKIKNNKTITYCKVDFIGSYDKIVQLETDKFSPNGIENNSFNKKTTVSIAKEEFPTKKDVEDSVMLCQYTYDCQSCLEKSIIDIGITINKVRKTVLNQLTDKEKFNILQEEKDRELVREEYRKSLYKEADKSDPLFVALKSRMQNYATGFYSKLFVKELDGKKYYAYCTCGTNMFSAQDWFTTNILQGLTGLSLQYTQSVQNAQILDSLAGRDFLFFIGHSLGGGLASNNAIVTERPAITFNAAGLSPLRLAATGKSKIKDQIAALWTMVKGDSLSQKNRQKGKNLVHAYVVKGELLNNILSHIMDEGAIGEIKEIELSNKSLTSLEKHSLINLIRKDDNNRTYAALEDYFSINKE